MKWFRLYDELIDDPKIMLIDEAFRWRYIAILCLVNRYERKTTGNRLPSDTILIFHLRLTQKELDETLTELLRVELVQKDKHGFYVKAFKYRQFDSDNVNERVKRYRKRYSNGDETVNVTAPDTDTETDTEAKRNYKEKKGGEEK
jgi:hypothetical protein